MESCRVLLNLPSIKIFLVQILFSYIYNTKLFAANQLMLTELSYLIMLSVIN